LPVSLGAFELSEEGLRAQARPAMIRVRLRVKRIERERMIPSIFVLIPI